MTEGVHGHGHDDDGVDQGGHSHAAATQFDSVEDGRVVRVAAERVQSFARKGTIVEVILVGIAAAALVFLAAVILNTSKVNQRGVHRIVDCTTAGHDCYEEQQRRTTLLVGELLAKLGEGHATLECYLGVVPDLRTDRTLEDCRSQAHERTEQQLAELRERARLAEEEARREANGRKTK